MSDNVYQGPMDPGRGGQGMAQDRRKSLEASSNLWLQRERTMPFDEPKFMIINQKPCASPRVVLPSAVLAPHRSLHKSRFLDSLPKL